MSSSTCVGCSSSTSLSRRTYRTSSTSDAMANEHSRLPLHPTHFQIPIPPIGESPPAKFHPHKPPTSTPSPTTPRCHFHTNESVSLKSAKQLYTFSNPPRELQRTRRTSNSSLLQHRVSSAPDENSPRSRLNPPKALSANDSMTLRAHADKTSQSVRSTDALNRTVKRSEQQRDLLNAHIQGPNKSKVPTSVQKRRLIFLIPRELPKLEHNLPFPIVNTPAPSPVTSTPSIPASTANRSALRISDTFDAADGNEPEMADSMQLAAILAEIQLDKDWSPAESAPKEQSTALDSSKYEYDVPNALDATTFKLSPRTLKPDEESAARKRFARYYQSEMRSSANAKIPSLIASIVTDNNSTTGSNGDVGPTFTFKWNGADSLKKSSSTDGDDLLESSKDNELVQLCYDATLKLFCDPNTGIYYDLSST